MLVQTLLPFGTVSADGVAGVTGGAVVAGQAAISHGGSTVNVHTMTDRTIINWNGFSIGAGETANFLQPSATSAVLNRVITPNNPSAIYGALNSNGNVILVNPSGIVVGPGGVINTNGFTASVLDIPNNEFLQGGVLNFRGDSTASVINRGTINTGSGGAALIGGDVINSGTITSEGGSISLATGGSVTLADGSRFTHADLATIESGISPYAGLIQNSGTIRATGAMETGGEVFLINPGGRILHDGTIAAYRTQPAGPGPAGPGQSGGIVNIDATGGSVEVAGMIDASGELGGQVVIQADHVELVGADIDVSGSLGGGSAKIGGGFQGNDPSIANAITTTVDSNSVIKADANELGDGGEVIIWSNAATDFAGTISATGGANGGDGGLVEVSGSTLAFSGTVSTTAANGNTGLLLLDPAGIVVQSGNSISVPDPQSILSIGDEALNSLLTTNNVLLATSPTSVQVISQDGSGISTTGTNNNDSIIIKDGTQVDTGTNTLFFSTSTLDLYSTITGNVSGGTAWTGAAPDADVTPLIDPTTVNVFIGPTTEGSIDQAMSIVADAGTIGLGAGTFDSFIIDRGGLTFSGTGSTTIIQAASPAVTIAADGTVVQNVLLQGTGLVDQVGILLDGTAAPDLSGVEIINVEFSNLDDGIRSQGDIGDGIAANVDVTIRGTSAVAPGIFEDFLDAAIDVGDTDGDAVYLVQDVVVQDGDSSGDSTLGDGMRFGEIGGVTIDRVNISDSLGDGIQFGALDSAVVTVSNSSISASQNGINAEGTVNGDTLFTVVDNQIGTSSDRIGDVGIVFQSGIFGNATITIGGANQVFANNLAIRATDLQSTSTLSIAGGTYNGTGGALWVSNLGVAGTDGRIDVGPANFVGGAGSPVFLVATDALSAGIDIDFSGAASFDGGATGVHLTGSGIDILNNTLGSVAFTNQTGNYIVLAGAAEFLPGSPTIIDATNVSFDGQTGSQMTFGELLVTEAKMVHHPDDSSLGLIDISELFVVQGESIQLAVNAAGALGGEQSVFVGPGTFGGSVEAWVDDLTLEGTGASTIIDTDQVDAFANNGDRDNGFEVIALSNIATNFEVNDLTIDGFSFAGSNGPTIGIELGGGNRAADDTIIRNSRFSGLRHGIVAHNIDDSTVFSGLTMTNIDRRGIDIRPNLGGDDSVLIEGSDIESDREAVRFGGALVLGASVVLRGNSLTSNNRDAVQFNDTILFSNVLIGGTTAGDANRIVGGDEGIDVKDDVVLSNFVVAGNSLIRGGDEAIDFDGETILSSISIVGNDKIRGGDDGILFAGGVLLSRIAVAGNQEIKGDEDGIVFANPIVESVVRIGTATALVDGNLVAYGGNNKIIGGEDGINVDDIYDSRFAVNDNRQIRGDTGSGIEFDGRVDDDSRVAVIANRQIIGGDYGIEFDNVVNDSIVRIKRNGSIRGDDQAGISFRDEVNRAVVRIKKNDVSSDNGDGILFDARVNDSKVRIKKNRVNSDDGGIRFADDVVDSTRGVRIANNEIHALDSAIEFDGRITDSIVDISDNLLVGVTQNGVSFEDRIRGTSMITVMGNDITAMDNGIETESIRGSSKVSLIDNDIVITGDGSGIRLRNVDSSEAVLVQGGSTSGGKFGLTVLQRGRSARDGKVIVDGLVVNQATDTGIRFVTQGANKTLEVTLLGGVTVNGGGSPSEVGMVFDGAGLSLTGNTLGDTRFVGTTGNFIELRNGGLFEPGQPTLIDGTDVYWDGLNPASNSQRQQIIDRIVDFLDDPTLGLIFPGAGLGEEQTYDRFTRYDDYFRTIHSLLGPFNPGSITYRTPTIEIAESLEEQAADGQ